ncbi:GNAT family N-acetyltransferase [Algoriphagus halophytocola]|uniref:GNAT family N-acetyltransferase n=1 Tax=Algoriphagus halophytocola TaxID=2991499 RepID=UPI0022DE0752|nr:GNAT family N-acetyltransferase [Algoriphagus sp. TR-M9]WBL44237.1 GNAT family N-acetyltransferase [Algoriphagus sp. TR-M9]
MKDEIEIQIAYSENEYLELISVFQQVLGSDKSKMDYRHINHFLKDDNFYFIVAKAKGKIIGGLTVFIINQYLVDKPYAYLKDLAVLEEYRGLEIDSKLVQFAVDDWLSYDFKDVIVHVNKEDTHTLALYRAVLPTSEKETIQFTFASRPKSREKEPKQ